MLVNWLIPVQHEDYNRMPASVWIRCLQLRPYLAQQGIDVVINQPESSASVHVFLRWQDEAAYQLAHNLKQKGKRIVFDLVVNYFDEATLPRLGTPVTNQHIQQTLRMLTVADVVTCASQFIANRAMEYHDWVVYIPDSVDDHHFCHQKPEADFYRKRLRAVWSGIVSKAFELEMILPLLRRYGIQLQIISNRRPLLRTSGTFLPHIFPYRFKHWRYKTFPKTILDGEICLSPRLLNSPYNRGHSFFKIGVFMAQGVPAIASPVPSYYELLAGNQGGEICATVEDWDNTLAMIMDDRQILARWSHEARLAVTPFTTQQIAGEYAGLISQL